MKDQGSVKVFEGRVYARVSFGVNERFEQRLPWASPNDLAPARDRASLIARLCSMLASAGRRDCVRDTAKALAEETNPKRLDTMRKAAENLAKLGAAAAPDSVATFKDVAEMWVKGELHTKHPDHMRPKTDFRLERGRLKRYVYPLVEDVPITAFEKSHADKVMASLPTHRIKTSAARRQIAQLVARVLNLAVMPLGLIKVTPLPKGWLPRIQRGRHYSCLYPHEEAKLLGCKAVDESFRLFIGILDREGMRVSELADSEWWQWNLEIGTFTATKTKTNDPRMWALRPDVVRAMRLWHQRHGKTKARPFIDVAPDQKTKDALARRLRESLELAGVTRAELLQSTAHTGALRTHDMRATFVTISICEGKSEAWIRDRTAHKTTAMIDRYRRTARQFEELKLGSLVDLVSGLGLVIQTVILAQASGDDTVLSTGDDGSSGAEIRTPIRGSKTLVGTSEAPSAPANDDGSGGADEPPADGSPGDHQAFRRLPPDLQDYVADRLSEVHRAVLAGDEAASLAPLAKAAKALDRGRRPRVRRGAK